MGKQLLFTIPGVPCPKKRHRTVPLQQCMSCQRTVQGQYGECPSCHGAMRFIKNVSYSDTETVKFENLVGYCGNQAKNGGEMLAGALKLSLTIMFPIPESRKCSSNHTYLDGAKYKPKSDCKKLHPGDWHTQRPDRSNVEKAVEDGLIGILFADDCTICDGPIRKIWSNEGKTEVCLEEL